MLLYEMTTKIWILAIKLKERIARGANSENFQIAGSHHRKFPEQTPSAKFWEDPEPSRKKCDYTVILWLFITE